MMPTEGGHLANLLERVLQMNIIIIEEMQRQRKEIQAQYTPVSTQLSTSSTAIDSSLRSVNKINVKPKEYDGTNEENVITWLTTLEEIMMNYLTNAEEKISLAVGLLGGTALQWFVNLKLKNERPSSWIEFKDKLISQFQPNDFQEHLRQQLLQLR